MKWIVFVIVAIFAVAIETSPIRNLVTLHALGDLYPSLVSVLLVFVALFAPRTTALWAAWGLGLFMDLALPRASGLLIGPLALGYCFGTFLVLQVRTMVFRRRLLTLAVLTMMFCAASAIVEVALPTIRSWFGSAVEFQPFVELLRRFGMAVYSGLLAIPVGWILMQTLRLWGFQHATDRRRTWK